jgi:hypothetical protein
MTEEDFVEGHFRLRRGGVMGGESGGEGMGQYRRVSAASLRASATAAYAGGCAIGCARRPWSPREVRARSLSSNWPLGGRGFIPSRTAVMGAMAQAPLRALWSPGRRGSPVAAPTFLCVGRDGHRGLGGLYIRDGAGLSLVPALEPSRQVVVSIKETR